MAGQTLSFGPFRLDPNGIVWRDGRPLPVGRRGVRLLEILLTRRGQVVPKAELFDAAWPNEAVEDSNLSVQIAQLRKHLGGDWIRTVERVGYQLIDETQPVLQFAAPTLVIRPFKNLGGAAEVLAALTDDLTTVFTRFGSLRVVATPGAVAAADYALEGSARREGAKLRVSIRLIEQRTGHYCWADRFEAHRTNGFPDGLIASVVEGRVEFAEIAAARRDRPAGESAPDLYRRALWHTHSLPADNTAAATLLERALDRDPDNPDYLGTICEAISLRISMGWEDGVVADADQLFGYASRGLRQPAVNTDRMAQFGFGLFRAGDPETGYSLMQRAADLNPNSLKAVCLAGFAAVNWGRSLADAEAYFHKGLSLDPRHRNFGAIMGGLSRIRMDQGDFEDAIRWAGRAHLANPHHGGSHWTLIAANAMLGRTEEAARCLDRFRVEHPGVTIDRIKAGQPNPARLSSTLEGLERAGLAGSH